jgi:hypothetical protein
MNDERQEARHGVGLHGVRVNDLNSRLLHQASHFLDAARHLRPRPEGPKIIFPSAVATELGGSSQKVNHGDLTPDGLQLTYQRPVTRKDNPGFVPCAIEQPNDIQQHALGSAEGGAGDQRKNSNG